MLNDVTFGQYYPTQSFVHRLDPRIKLLALIGIIVLIFCSHNFYALGLCAILVFAAIAASRVPFLRVLKSVKAILFIMLFTTVLNIFFYSGEELLWSFGIIKIYREGLTSALFLILRLFFLIMASSVLTLTTTPVALTDGIESLLKPLKLIRFPVHELALIMSIALRFIPTLIDETNRIISAQKARGADFESGNLFKRIKAIVPVLIPLLISAFRRADELGDAMDARCYSGSKTRTKYKKLTFGARDFVAVLIFAAAIAGVVLFNIYGFQICPEIYKYMAVVR